MSSTPLLIDEPPLQVLPTLAQAIGLNEAIVLQQVHYWLNPRFNKNFFEERYWVRNTYEQWRQQFPFFSERTLRRTIGSLEALGLLVSCMGGHLKQIKFYTVNYGLLNQADLANLHRVSQARSQKKPDEGNPCQEIQETLRNGEIDSSGQNDHSWPNWPDGKTGNSPETIENQIVRPSWPKWPPHLAKMATPPGQNGHLIWPDWPPPLVNLAISSGQIGHLSYSENTIREYTENTLPPPLLPPPSQVSPQKEEDPLTSRAMETAIEPINKQGNSQTLENPEEEDEKKKNKFGFENSCGNLEQERGVGGQNSQGQNSLENCVTEEKKTVAPGVGEHEPKVRDCKLGTREDLGIRETAAQISVELVNGQGSSQVQENSTASEMIAIWNQIVQEKLNPGQNSHLTPKRKTLLEQFLHAVFPSKAREEKLDAWKDYCTLIANSRFLAGENPSGFKISLDWALVPEKAYKVLEGVIYDKPQKPTLNNNPQNQSWEDLETEIRQNSLQRQAYQQLYVEEWMAICKNLAKTLGHAVFKSWFFNTVLVKLTNDTAIIQAETNFMRDYIDSHFRLDIMRSIQALHPTVTQIKFQVAPHSDGKQGNILSQQEIYHD